jgi:hypothetical protein
LIAHLRLKRETAIGLAGFGPKQLQFFVLWAVVKCIYLHFSKVHLWMQIVSIQLELNFRAHIFFKSILALHHEFLLSI